MVIFWRRCTWSNHLVLWLMESMGRSVTLENHYIVKSRVLVHGFGEFSQAVKTFGMLKRKSNHPVFYKYFDAGIILLVVNVDDIVIIGSDNKWISSLKSLLHT